MVFERSLDKVVYRRQARGFLSLLGFVGGVILVLWLIGYCIVKAVTIGSYEDQMVQALYPTKHALMSRIEELFPDEADQRIFADIL